MMYRCKKEPKGQLLASKATNNEHRQPHNLPLCPQPHPEILSVHFLEATSYFKSCDIIHDFHFHTTLLCQ